LYASPIIRVIDSRLMRLAGHVECMGDKRNRYTIYVGKPEEMRPILRHRRSWKNNIRMDHR